MNVGALPPMAFIMVVANEVSSPRAAASRFNVSRLPGAPSTRLLMASLIAPAVASAVDVAAAVPTVECVTMAASRYPSSRDSSPQLVGHGVFKLK